DELRDAFEGRVASEVSTLERQENVGDRRFGKLLEVYVPLRFGPQEAVDGAFEIYKPYAPLAASIDHDTRTTYALLLAGLGLLWVALFRIVAGASQRLRRQAEENRHQARRDAMTGL